MAEQLSAELARRNKEPLYGTIKSANVWFLLEYNGVYTNQAWEDARIPDEVKDKLDHYPHSRPLLIRQPEKANAFDRLTSFYVIHANTAKPAIYHLELESYTDILDYDIDAILTGDLVPATNEALYVVCTNGKRDVCCSKYGIALYNALSLKVHDYVWQSSHIGGHRFAGTMYCFPDALCYGFLSEDDAPQVVKSYNDRRILLDKIRGHAIYDKPIQAAEFFLRQRIDNDKIDDVQYLSHTNDGDTWAVQFGVDNLKYQVNITLGTPIHVLATTGDEEFKEVEQYDFLDYHLV